MLGGRIPLDHLLVHRPEALRPFVGHRLEPAGIAPADAGSTARGEARQAQLAVRHVAAPEDAVLLALGGEQVRPFDRLGGAQHEVPLRIQGVVEDADHIPLRLALQVDQQVAAGDEVQVRERRILQQIVRREGDDIAYRFADAVGRVLLGEEPLEPFGGDLGADRLGIHSLARPLQSALVQIAREDLELGRIGSARSPPRGAGSQANRLPPRSSSRPTRCAPGPPAPSPRKAAG